MRPASAHAVLWTSMIVAAWLPSLPVRAQTPESEGADSPAAAQDPPPPRDDPGPDADTAVEDDSAGGTAPHPDTGAPPSAEREARLRFEAGRLAREQGRLEEALEDFRRANELAPSADRAWAVADLLGALGRSRDELAAYRAFLAVAPDDPRAAEARARVAVLERTTALPAPAVPASDGQEASTDSHGEPSPSSTVLDEPWFWVVVAVAALGVLAAALFGTESRGTQAPLPGSEGTVVRTLVEAP